MDNSEVINKLQALSAYYGARYNELSSQGLKSDIGSNIDKRLFFRRAHYYNFCAQLLSKFPSIRKHLNQLYKEVAPKYGIDNFTRMRKKKLNDLTPEVIKEAEKIRIFLSKVAYFSELKIYGYTSNLDGKKSVEVTVKNEKLLLEDLLIYLQDYWDSSRRDVEWMNNTMFDKRGMLKDDLHEAKKKLALKCYNVVSKMGIVKISEIKLMVYYILLLFNLITKEEHDLRTEKSQPRPENGYRSYVSSLLRVKTDQL